MARAGAGAGGPAHDPGTAETTLLAGRYRLESRLGERAGSSVWRATDEVLGRRVVVHTFPAGSHLAGAVVAAARSACRVTDPRLVQIFDADDNPAHPYIVTEWSSGSRLGDLLTTGPLGPLHAATIIAEAADAVAAAHAAGLAHLCLTPDAVWCNARGEVKVSGLGISATLTMAHAADPALADTQGLARLLYAAVTGCWPGGDETTLPAAPRRDGRACAPHEVRTGIPAGIDAVICRALFGEADGDGPPILGPAQFAMELQSIAHVGEPLPAAHPPLPGPGWPDGDGLAPVPYHRSTTPLPPALLPAPGGPLPDGQGGPLPGAPGPPGSPGPVPARRARWPGVTVKVLAAAALVALLAAGGWLLAHRAAGTGGPAAGGHPGTASRLPVPVSVVSFDPYGDGKGENSQLASRAIDASTATAWRSDWYTSARFGNLKPGTGLLLDMGHPVTITGARLILGRAAGADFQVRIGRTASSLHALPPAARVTGAGGAVRVRLGQPVRGRYVLIWFTRLPANASGTFQVSVYDIRLDGRA